MKINLSEKVNIFLYAFGVFCFACVISSASYVKGGIALCEYESDALFYMLLFFLIGNVIVSLFISQFLLKLSNSEFVTNLLSSLFLYSVIAQICFYFITYNYNVHYSILLFSTILISVIFFHCLQHFNLKEISVFLKTIAHLSAIVFAYYLVFSLVEFIEYKKAYTGKPISLYNAPEEIFEKFNSSSKKKPSIFFILFDEIPFTFIYDGNSIIDPLPNIKALSKKSLFFTNAIAQSDTTSHSMLNIFTGRYSWKKITRKEKEWLTKSRNIFGDLKNCGYNLQVSRDYFSIHSALYPHDKKMYYGKKSLIFATINFISKMHTFKRVKPFFFFHSVRIVNDTEIIKGIDFKKLKDESPLLYYIHFDGSHAPYVYDRNGEMSWDREHNSYFSYNYSDMLPAEEAPLVNKRHLDALIFCDKILGKMITNILDAFGEDNVLIVFLSDHGIGWRGKLLSRAKGFYTWDIAKVPLMIYYPSKIKPSVSNTLFPLIDLLPTLYDILGIEYNEKEFHGLSLFNNKRIQPRNIFAHSQYQVHMIKDGAWIPVRFTRKKK